MAPLAVAAILGAALVPVCQAVVCDKASAAQVPCVKLVGGHEMPQIAMGTGGYKDCAMGEFRCKWRHARFAVENWLHLGAGHIDTANDYRTQTAVAAALEGTRREEVFITTKCPGPLGYEGIIQCADANLQMLGQFTDDGVGYIDLLLIHFPALISPRCSLNATTPFFEPGCTTAASKEQLQDSWRAMEELKKLGVVRAIGVSNYNTTNLQQTLETAKEPIEVNQVEWHPMHHDGDLLAFCRSHGVQLQAWSPLGGRGTSVLSHPTVQAIATAHNVSTAQVTLRWSLQQGVPVVIGTDSASHAASDLQVFGFGLAPDEMDQISAIHGTVPGPMLPLSI